MSTEEFKSVKLTLKKGQVGDMATEYWTGSDWESHRKHVEELKAKGEYLKEEEVIVHYKPWPVMDNPGKSEFKDVGVFIPMGKKLEEQSYIIHLLEKYSQWLTKHGYMDTDWKDEEPYAIDEFLKELRK